VSGAVLWGAVLLGAAVRGWSKNTGRSGDYRRTELTKLRNERTMKREMEMGYRERRTTRLESIVWKCEATGERRRRGRLGVDTWQGTRTVSRVR